MSRQCQYLLCTFKPRGLVRMQVYTKPEATIPDIREVEMCEPCADIVGKAFNKGARLHMTPGGAIYIGDLDQWLPRKRPAA